MFANLLSILSLASLVLSHGVVTDIQIGPKHYPGPQAGGPSSMSSIIRQITTFNPNYGATNPAVNCGPGARFAKEVGTVNPGDSISFTWKTGNQKWAHAFGPMMTYLAECKGDCRTYNTSNAQWFKIDAAGFKNGKWIQEQTVYTNAGGKPYTFTFPKNIKSGDYIMRHEIIALHLAENRKQAEFYPSCSQIHVTGSGTGVPAAKDLVKIPGAYSDDDPGLWCKHNEQYGNGSNYKMPGPAIATLAVQAPAPAGGSSPSDDDDTPKNVSTGPKCKVNKKRSPHAKRLRRAKRNHSKRHSKRLSFESSA